MKKKYYLAAVLLFVIFLPVSFGIKAVTSSYNITFGINTISINAAVSNNSARITGGETPAAIGVFSTVFQRFGILDFDVSLICGNDICEAQETYNNCPLDCPPPQVINNDDDTSSHKSSGPGPPSAPNSDLDRISIIVLLMEPQNSTKIKITNDNFGIYETIVDVLRRLENVRFTFIKLKIKPDGVKEAKDNEIIYKYLEIKQDKNASDVKKIKLKFKVEKDWLDNYSIDESLIRLYRFTTDWVELKTDIDSFDKDYVYYQAETLGLSYFKIAAIKPEEEEQTEEQNESEKTQITPPKEQDVNKTKDSLQENKTIFTLKNIIGGSIIFIILSLIITFALLKYHNTPVKDKNLYDREHIRILADYFKKAVQKKIDLEKATEKLLKKGWKKKEIIEALKVVQKEE